MRYRVPLTLCVAPVIEFTTTVTVEARSAAEAAQKAMAEAPASYEAKWRRKPGQPRSFGPGGAGVADEYFDEQGLSAWVEAQTVT